MIAAIGAYVFKRKWKWPTFFVTAAIAYGTPGVSGAWVWLWGLAFTFGCAIHCLGDGCTETGIPWLWHPFRRGPKRWERKFVLPEKLRFSTGHFGEQITLFFMFLLTIGLCFGLILFV
jgi:hypothetical protein